jgi:hypothetical protein
MKKSTLMATVASARKGSMTLQPEKFIVSESVQALASQTLRAQPPSGCDASLAPKSCCGRLEVQPKPA